MTGYTKELEQDTEREKAKHERNMENLSKRKEELLRERKHKLKVRLSIRTHFCIQGRSYTRASMGCGPGAPRLEGSPSSKNYFKILDTGANIHNEGPQILLAQGPFKA